jgi:hypothetical protein
MRCLKRGYSQSVRKASRMAAVATGGLADGAENALADVAASGGPVDLG